jgi:hypothetical protein
MGGSRHCVSARFETLLVQLSFGLLRFLSIERKHLIQPELYSLIPETLRLRSVPLSSGARRRSDNEIVE